MTGRVFAICLLLSFSRLAFTQDTTVFRATFDYETTSESVEDIASLNGGIDQIGTFSGTLPGGVGKFEPALIGFVESLEVEPEPMILIDRPLEDGVFFADFVSPIAIDGAKVSFDIGTRRTSGEGHLKDYDVIGLDSQGVESFHLRMSAFTGDSEEENVARVGYVSENGNVSYDLPTIDGDDFNGDLPGAGKPPYDPGLLGFVELTLGAEGYSLFFESGTNFYTSDVLAYNGEATSISQLAFSFFGDEDENPLRSGFVLDDIFASGTVIEELVGDCNGDGILDISDANCASDLDDLLASVGSLRGDLDGDGTVQFADFLVLSQNFAKPGAYTDGDLDLDGQVQFGDFLILSDNFGAAAEAASVPEPSALSLILAALGALLAVRRGRARKA